MLLASKTIQAGRIARRIGETLEDNPHELQSGSIVETPNGMESWFDDVDHHGLWEAGWNIENRYGKGK